MTSNRFKQALLDGRPQVGLWLSLGDAYSAELCAASGFDWLMIDAEHGPNDLRTVLAQLQAIAAYDAQPVVRPVNGSLDVLKPLLDLGATNLLVPMISTAQQARELVTAVRYPPKGKRGIGHALARASRWNRDSEYFTTWEDNALILAQIETTEALQNLEAILAVEGIDGYFIGPADLAASLGYPGQMAHPEVMKAMDEAIETIRRAGKPVGTIVLGEEATASFFAKGCSFVAAHVDALLLAAGADAVARGVKSRLEAL